MLTLFLSQAKRKCLNGFKIHYDFHVFYICYDKFWDIRLLRRDYFPKRICNDITHVYLAPSYAGR